MNFLKGKKTYIIAAATFIVGGLMAAGVVIPPWVLLGLASFGVATGRSAIADLK